jgi:hypothetical protein
MSKIFLGYLRVCEIFGRVYSKGNKKKNQEDVGNTIVQLSLLS